MFYREIKEYKYFYETLFIYISLYSHLYYDIKIYMRKIIKLIKEKKSNEY